MSKPEQAEAVYSVIDIVRESLVLGRDCKGNKSRKPNSGNKRGLQMRPTRGGWHGEAVG